MNDKFYNEMVFKIKVRNEEKKLFIKVTIIILIKRFSSFFIIYNLIFYF